MKVNATRDVTSLFWPRQDGRQFLAQPADFKRLKSSFQRALAKKKLAMFVSEVETLLLCKNLRYKNFLFSSTLTIEKHVSEDFFTGWRLVFGR